MLLRKRKSNLPSPRRWWVIAAFAITVFILGYHTLREMLTPTDPVAINLRETSPIKYGPTLNGQHACSKNPYQDAVSLSFDHAILAAQHWLDAELGPANAMADDGEYSKHDHARFFPFNEMMHCKDLQCVGGICSQDRSKYACGMNYLSQLDNCAIYSIGSQDSWEFELDLLKRTNCQIHTFDCTGRRERFHVPEHENLHFHHICLGAQKLPGLGDDHPSCNIRTAMCGPMWTLRDMQQHLGHDKIDLLKLDIEGWEWPIFDIPSTDASMPMEVLIEVHYGGPWRGTKGVIHSNGTSSAKDLVRLQSHLLGLGYVVIHRDDNRSCKHCTELTLMRVAC